MPEGRVQGIADSGLMYDSVQTLFDFAGRLKPPLKENVMNIAIQPILALVIGILILVVPRFLNYFVAVYLIVVGILGLMHS